MKKLISLFLVCILMLAVALPTSAAQPKEVVKGTAVVDGTLDDAYLDSAHHAIRNRYVWSWGSFKEGNDMPSSGDIYFLWDEDYLYICAVIKDSTTTSQAGDKTWQNDSLEHFFNDVHDSGAELGFKINQAADGTFFLGTDLSGVATFDLEDCQHATTYTDDGYIVEAAFPLTDMQAGKTFDYSAQLIDIWDVNYRDGYAKGSSERDLTFVCVENKGDSTSTVATTTTTQQQTEAQTTTTAPAADDAATTSNSDVIVLCIVGAVVAAAVVAVVIVLVKSKKKG